LDALRHYREVWAVDFEFTAPPGHRPDPLCIVARELRTGRLVRRWLCDGDPGGPPYGTGPDTLLVAYYASAEWGCHLACGRPMPGRALDLFAEFAWLTSGASPPNGRGLLGALAYHGLQACDAAEKESMRALAMRGGPYDAGERDALLDYCQSDVDSLARRLPAMLPGIDLPRALLRGRYTVAAARMEWAGVPIDVESLDRLRDGWDRIKNRLIRAVDADYGLFVPADPRAPDGPMSFSAARWADYLARHRIPWPRLDSGALAMDDDTFKEMARLHPAHVGPVRELRHALSQLKLNDLAVGPDGRNRCLLSMFGSKTGRNQPSTSAFVFGPACWLRSLIRPPRDWAVGYVDWSAQELGIAAVQSGDRRMMDAYASGDPYLWFGKFAGLVPAGATKTTHGAERGRFKVVMLGVLYGLSAAGLARKLGLTPRRRPRTAAIAPGDVPHLPALVGRRPGPGGARRRAADGVRVAGAGRAGDDADEPAELPHAGERGRDDAAGRVPGDRAGRPGVLPGPRRLPHRGARRRDRGRGRPDAAGDGRGVGAGAAGVPAADRRDGRPPPRPVLRPARGADVGDGVRPARRPRPARRTCPRVEHLPAPEWRRYLRQSGAPGPFFS
jgi:hypothetical protein